MTELTDLQHKLLTAAAAADDTCARRPDDITAAKWKAATAPLVKAGWLLSMPVDGGGSDLLLTEAGRGLVSPPARKGRKPMAAAPEAPATLAAPAATPTAATPPKGKIGVLVELLRREGGATIDDMMGATGWQAHSVRGALSGSVKKGLGLTVASDKGEGGRVYRIVGEAA